ncbi:hypothetical protein BRD19_01735 [Halobacteriales archaeon SW_7_65_23]|nr:MAG: hypothetical protein BRD19_01735 [Halobacteriales archaeon SW_7_65_23]
MVRGYSHESIRGNSTGVFHSYTARVIQLRYKRLRQRLQTAIAVNEDAIDAAVVDLIPMGGLLAAKQAMGLADDATFRSPTTQASTSGSRPPPSSSSWRPRLQWICHRIASTTRSPTT